MAPNCSTLSEPELKMLEHLVFDIPAEFNVAQFSSRCIYRVPPNLWKVNPEAYTPQLIAIGPLHRQNPKLKPMETEKARYFHFFWKRCQYHTNAQELLQFYKFQLQEEEERIRHSYAEKLPKEYSKEKLVEMVFLDAVFIMELIIRFCEENHDHMSTELWLRKSILRDLLLLENQIPMFVLEELYHTYRSVCPPPTTDKSQTRSEFLKLASEYFREIHKRNFDNNTRNSENLRHFPDMIRYLCRPGILKSDGENEKSSPSFLKTATQSNEAGVTSKKCNPSVLKTATQLNEAGVTFEKGKDECLLDINFKKERLSCFLCLSCFPKSRFSNCFKARLKIPQLKVDHWTESLFRNLIAFEQCHYPKEPYICNYVSLIDSLIHTKDDVELLVEKEVISHDLGSHKELATVVNGLCKYVVMNGTCYQRTIDDLNSHYDHRWNRSMAALRLVYFRDPWRASSTVVGVAVLVFTIFNFCRVLHVLYY